MGVAVAVADDAIRVRLDGPDRLWALLKGFDLALSDVTGLRVADRTDMRRDVRWRVLGLGIPGAALVGRVRGREARRQFWVGYRAPRYLVIDLAPTARFDRVVLQVEDPDGVADEIRSALG